MLGAMPPARACTWLPPLLRLQREWHVLLYGANSTARQDPRFQMCSVGTALGEQDLSHRIFRFSGCLPDTRAHVLSGKPCRF